MIRSFLSVRFSDCDVLFRDIVSLPPAKKIGRIDIACGCAGNHTHVMGPEELRRAALTKTRLREKWGVGTRTMIMADNPGLSWSIVKPFAEAGVENVIFAPNQWNPIPCYYHALKDRANYVDVEGGARYPFGYGLSYTTSG